MALPITSSLRWPWMDSPESVIDSALRYQLRKPNNPLNDLCVSHWPKRSEEAEPEDLGVDDCILSSLPLDLEDGRVNSTARRSGTVHSIEHGLRGLMCSPPGPCVPQRERERQAFTIHQNSISTERPPALHQHRMLCSGDDPVHHPDIPLFLGRLPRCGDSARRGTLPVRPGSR